MLVYQRVNMIDRLLYDSIYIYMTYMIDMIYNIYIYISCYVI